MYPTTYGRSKLVFYDNLAVRAFERLAEVLADMAASPAKPAQRLMAEAIRRKRARLRSVFPSQILPDESESYPGLSAKRERLCLITACWIDAIKALADDNELDVLFHDGNGQARPAGDIITEAILDDAVLAGRLIEIRRL